MSPSSTPTTPAATAGTGSRAWPSRSAAPAQQGLSQCHDLRDRGHRGHAARVLPRAAGRPQRPTPTSNACARLYPGVYGADGGFYDAVNPTTGAVGHRHLVLDQSMIMAALDNALRDRALQRDFARDPVAWAAHTYLSMETMFIAG